jgi:hypothetical protein
MNGTGERIMSGSIRRLKGPATLGLGVLAGLTLLLGNGSPARAEAPQPFALAAFDPKDGWKEREKREDEREREWHKRESENRREWHKRESENQREWHKRQAEMDRERAKRYEEARKERWKRYDDDDDDWRDRRYSRYSRYDGRSRRYSRPAVQVRTLPRRNDRDRDGVADRYDRYPRDPQRR